MPYFPIIPGTDNRRETRGCLPTVLRNCMVEKAPEGASRRSPYFIMPTPGRTLRATMAANSRGLYAEPGSISGNLIAPAGSDLNKVTSAYTVTSIGSITGTDDVQMVPFQANMALLADSVLYHNDGATHTQITDADAPSAPSTLASCAYRLVAANAAADAFSWSKAGLYNDWATDGTAADIYLPDPIVNQLEINAELWSFNSRSIQIWQPTGGAEAEAFAASSTGGLRVGLLTKQAIARVRDGAMFIGSDRRVYRTSGSGAEPVVNRDLETALAALSATDIAANVRCWSYTQEAKTFFGVVMGLERGFVYDLDLGLWHERTRYGYGAYDIDFATTAFDAQEVVVASASQPSLWTLDQDVYTDAGTAIEREMTIHVPAPGDASIDQIVFDMEFRDQPTTGQGSAPTMLVSVSRDGGEAWSEERSITLPTLGQYRKRIRASRWGSGYAEQGMMIRIRLSDPIYFAVFGVWINPSMQEVP